MRQLFSIGIACLFVEGLLLTGGPFALLPHARATSFPVEAGADDGWYFAVSGDSRDCGDIIMPKIARAIADRRLKAPAQFYWHLGDFRAIYRVDCDIIKRTDPSFQCPAPPKSSPEYIKTAWDDFIKHQLVPFGKTPVILGVGNHELYGNLTRYQF